MSGSAAGAVILDILLQLPTTDKKKADFRPPFGKFWERMPERRVANGVVLAMLQVRMAHPSLNFLQSIMVIWVQNSRSPLLRPVSARVPSLPQHAPALLLFPGRIDSADIEQRSAVDPGAQTAIEDRLDDGGREEGKAHYPDDVGDADPFLCC